MKKLLLTLTFGLAANLFAAEYLVEFYKHSPSDLAKFTKTHGGSLTLVSRAGSLYKWTLSADLSKVELRDSNVSSIQKNNIIRLIENPSLARNQAAINELARTNKLNVTDGPAYPDNPEIPSGVQQSTGSDPMMGKQWGFAQVKAAGAQQTSPQGKDIVVAVTDTGVDYTHPDLVNQMWRNEDEIAGNGIDDDKNGYVDDIVGWDFATNDNKPYDLSLSLIDILMSGGNPGHGTHVAGVIGSTANNGMGILGIAPKVKIMALRFITEKGQGTTEAAIKAIDYAVDNGAKIINASWGGEKGEESGDDDLLKAIERAKAKGVLFIAAAGNGRVDQAAGKAVGFNNDTDPKPVLPATFNLENMITVAAIDVNEKMGEFSNYGPKSVHIGAPGVNILSTVPGNRYQDTIIELGTMKVTWDGTSMATPHVVGAMALLWSTDPNMNLTLAKEKLLAMTVKIPALSDKVATGGRLDLSGIK